MSCEPIARPAVPWAEVPDLLRTTAARMAEAAGVLEYYAGFGPATAQAHELYGWAWELIAWADQRDRAVVSQYPPATEEPEEEI